jgi:hypothetical protein
MRPTLIALLLLAGSAALLPPASADCVDARPDDDGVGLEGCGAGVLGECSAYALAYGELPESLAGAGCTSLNCRGDAVPDGDGVTQRCRALTQDCTVTAPRFDMVCYRVA